MEREGVHESQWGVRIQKDLAVCLDAVISTVNHNPAWENHALYFLSKDEQAVTVPMFTGKLSVMDMTQHEQAQYYWTIRSHFPLCLHLNYIKLSNLMLSFTLQNMWSFIAIVDVTKEVHFLRGAELPIPAVKENSGMTGFCDSLQRENSSARPYWEIEHLFWCVWVNGWERCLNEMKGQMLGNTQ